MTVSFPSKPIHVFDSPEVESIKAKFIYNFFVSNEKIDETGYEKIDGSLPSKFKRKGSADFSNLRARVPRYVMLQLNYSDKNRMMDPRVGRGNDIYATKKELANAVADGKVVTETNATSRVYNAFTLGNSSIDSEIENVMRTILNRYVVMGRSPTQAVKNLSKITNVDIDTVSMMLPPTLNDAVSFIQHDSLSKQVDGLSSVRSQVQLNSRFAPMMLRKSVERGTSLLDGSVNANFMTAKGIVENNPILRSNFGKASSNSPDDLQFAMPFFRRPEVIDPGKDVSASSGVVGVLVEKTRVLNGKKYKMPSIIVPGKKPETVFDTQVAYGQTYEYKVRTLSLFKIPITTSEGERLLATYLVASKESQPVQAQAIETRAPSPPSDIDFFYNYESNNLTLLWKPPVNPQRDVKYYQVFRRKSLNDPFELLCVLDFDDSVIREYPKETIDPSVVRSYNAPAYTFIDDEFSKDTEFIYAVVAVDARQISSTYSTQVKVSFNNSRNRIEKDLVCRQGSPKQYPNWTKKENFFVDTMKDSAHSRVKIYFDPEAYTVIDKNGVETPLFLTNSNDMLAKYVFQFISTDRLAEQRFEVTIDDTAFRQGSIGSKTFRSSGKKSGGTKEAAKRDEMQKRAEWMKMYKEKKAAAKRKKRGNK